MNDSSGVQSLDRAFTIIEILAKQPQGMLLSELAAKSGLHKSTAHRILASLMHWGYVKKSGERGENYAITLKMFELSGPITDNLDISQVARPHLDSLRDRTGETVHLVVQEGNEIVYIYKAEYTLNSYRMSSHLGMRREMYCTAAGKCLLAHMDRDRVGEIWQQSSRILYTDKTIKTADELYNELENISARGFAYDMEENEIGVRCVAAAVSDYSKSWSSAISLSAPVARMNSERMESLVSEIKKTAADISREMGYTAN